MRIALLVLVAVAGVAVTIFAAVRMWRANRSGAPRELVLGYAALMVAATVVTSLLVRAL
jgi:hypothetical protein